MAPTQCALTQDQLREWLSNKVAEEAGIEQSIISQCEPLSRYGLTSMQAVTIAGDLETFLGRRIAPTLLWENPSIDAVAKTLIPQMEVPGTT
jgi:acyl carrier protein